MLKHLLYSLGRNKWRTRRYCMGISFSLPPPYIICYFPLLNSPNNLSHFPVFLFPSYPPGSLPWSAPVFSFPTHSSLSLRKLWPSCAVPAAGLSLTVRWGICKILWGHLISHVFPSLPCFLSPIYSLSLLTFLFPTYQPTNLPSSNTPFSATFITACVTCLSPQWGPKVVYIMLCSILS